MSNKTGWRPPPPAYSATKHSRLVCKDKNVCMGKPAYLPGQATFKLLMIFFLSILFRLGGALNTARVVARVVVEQPLASPRSAKDYQ